MMKEWVIYDGLCGAMLPAERAEPWLQELRQSGIRTKWQEATDQMLDKLEWRFDLVVYSQL